MATSLLQFTNFDVAVAGVGKGIVGVRLEHVVAPVAGSRKVGRRRAGVFCLPAGVVRWNDLVIPNAEQLEQAMMAEFEQDGDVRIIQTYRLAQHSPQAVLAMRGKITKANVSLCVPGLDLGIAIQPAVKGNGSITIEWEVWSENTKTLIKRETVESSFNFRNEDPRRSPEVLANAIAESARSIFR